MKQNKLIGIVLALAFLFVFTGCPFTTAVKPQTPQTMYDSAIGWWYDAEQNFKMFYTAAAPAEQVKMISFAKALLEAKRVLNLWEFYLEGNQPTGTYSDSFKKKKNELILMMANKYKEVE